MMHAALPVPSRMNGARAHRTASAGVSCKAFKFPFFGGEAKQTLAEKRKQMKGQLFDLLGPLDRGAAATEDDKLAVDAVASTLEKMNPNPKTLASPLVNGSWELRYTTSASILGLSRPPFLRPIGKIFQVIDAEALKARNIETTPFFNQVSANLTPLSNAKVAVQFQEFRIFNIIPVKAPPSAKGELEITYVDEDLRISRGDKGNLFILTMADRNQKP